MIGPAHYEAAEDLLAMASEAANCEPLLARAQVHATLALAAAIGLGMAAAEPSAAAERAWYEAAGTKPEVTP